MLEVSLRTQLGAFRLNAQLTAGQGVTVLYGRSGSGKTSLINAIAGLLPAQHAQISLGTRQLADTKTGLFVPPDKRRIGYVFQDARLFPHMTVSANLDYGARFAERPLRGSDRDQLIETLGIQALLNRKPDALSGGEKQRVALGRALMTRPELMLLDEPLAGLDADRKADILPYLANLTGPHAPPMIYVTHDMNEIVRLADHLAVMREGKCVVQGPVQDVLSDPQNVPLIGVQDAGALLTGRVAGHAKDGLTELTLSAASVSIPALDAPVGRQVRIRVRAQDVLLSATVPQHYSGLNALPVTVTEIKHGHGPGVAVALQSGEDRILSRVTARAVAQMNLQVGCKVFALVNASALPATSIAIL